jgi:hypothetical protein
MFLPMADDAPGVRLADPREEKEVLLRSAVDIE